MAGMIVMTTEQCKFSDIMDNSFQPYYSTIDETIFGENAYDLDNDLFKSESLNFEAITIVKIKLWKYHLKTDNTICTKTKLFSHAIYHLNHKLI